MFANLARDLDTVHDGERMIQLRAILLVPTLDWATAVGQPTAFCGHPFHGVWVERQEIVPALVLVLCATVRNTSYRLQGRRNLARMNGLFEQS